VLGTGVAGHESAVPRRAGHPATCGAGNRSFRIGSWRDHAAPVLQLIQTAKRPNNGVSTVIEVEHLTKRYGPVVAVDDISFQVKKGEILGFLGPNGAGKTTTMRVLTGYIPATAGRAVVAGYDVFDKP